MSDRPGHYMTSMNITTMSVALLHPFMDLLFANDCTENEAAGMLSIEVIELRDPETMVTATKMYSFLNWAAERVGDRMLGARQGVLMASGTWAPIVRYLEEARNLVDILTRFCIAASEDSGASRYQLETNGDVAVFKMTRPSIEAVDTSQVDAVAVGVFVELIRSSANDFWSPNEIVALTSDPTCIPSDLLPGASVLQGRSGVTLRFPSKWLLGTLPPASATPHMQAPRYPGTASLPAERLIRRVLGRNLADANFSLDDAARELCLSKSKLQETLKSAGCNFSSMRKVIQRERGVELVRSSSEPIWQIAGQLGYKRVSNFTRAFRVWTGKTPTEFRKQQSKPSEAR